MTSGHLRLAAGNSYPSISYATIAPACKGMGQLLVKTSRNSSRPWSWVVTKPAKLGFAML
jgi:hypothetical protein